MGVGERDKDTRTHKQRERERERETTLDCSQKTFTDLLKYSFMSKLIHRAISRLY